MTGEDPAKSTSLLAFLQDLEPLDEDFPPIEDPPPEPVTLAGNAPMKPSPTLRG